jgi:hypothetical protein
VRSYARRMLRRRAMALAQMSVIESRQAKNPESCTPARADAAGSNGNEGPGGKHDCI